MSARLSSLGAFMLALGSLTLACEVTSEEKPSKPSHGGDEHAGEAGAANDGDGQAGAADQDDEPGTSNGGQGNKPNKPGSDTPPDPGVNDPDNGEEPEGGSDPGQVDPPSGANAHYFLPTPEPTNTRAPTLEVDARGGVHAVYPRNAIGGAFYAYCAKDCDQSSDLKVVQLDTEGTVLNAMLALDTQGRPRVLLSTAQKVYYATCDSDCGTPASWETSMILDHEGIREVSGEAFALDPEGRPRFLLHTYRALLGVGQKPRATLYVSCDSDCHSPAGWTASQIVNQTWEGTNLEFDAQGRAHIATVANLETDGVVTNKNAAYLRCDADCDSPESWVGTGLYPAFEHTTTVPAMKPTISLALTRTGHPRVALIGANPEDGSRNIMYASCDENCQELASWHPAMLSNHSAIRAGLDLALDANDHPRVAYNFNDNIALVYCDAANCADADWDNSKVEFTSDLPPDEIILEWNCTVAAWFFHSPSIAITPSGTPVIGYQAVDMSGGFSRPEPTKPRCEAGADMTLTRMTVLNTYVQ